MKKNVFNFRKYSTHVAVMQAPFKRSRKPLNSGPKNLEFEKIWFPEWLHFCIIRISAFYFLFDGNKLAYHSLSLESVKTELVERFHFYANELSGKEAGHETE